MNLYIVVEDVDYGEFGHIVRARNRTNALKLARMQFTSKGKVNSIKLLSAKGKEEHIITVGSME